MDIYTNATSLPTLYLNNGGTTNVVYLVITQNIDNEMELENLKERSIDQNTILLTISEKHKETLDKLKEI